MPRIKLTRSEHDVRTRSPALQSADIADLVILVDDLRDLREHPGLGHWPGRTAGILLRRIQKSFARKWVGASGAMLWWVDVSGLEDALAILGADEFHPEIVRAIRNRITQVIAACKKEIGHVEKKPGCCGGCACGGGVLGARSGDARGVSGVSIDDELRAGV